MGGSAKALGLVRGEDSESTATVTRLPPNGTGALPSFPDVDGDDHDAEEGGDGVATVLKGQKKLTFADDGDPDDADPATVMKGQRRIAFSLPSRSEEAAAAEALEAAAASVSSDDDDLNETKRADDDPDATPVGLKKIPTPLPPPPAAELAPRVRSTPPPRLTPVPPASASAPPPPPAEAAVPPESGCTRVAPITAPPPTVNASPVMTAPAPGTPAQAWLPPQAPPSAPPATSTHPLVAKVLAAPPHKLALIVSLTLMAAALMFVFLRSRPVEPVPTAAVPTFPAAPEIPPAVAAPPPAIAVVLPPPAPTWNSQAQAQPPQPPSKTEAKTEAKTRHVRPSIPRATSRTTIPIHREE